MDGGDREKWVRKGGKGRKERKKDGWQEGEGLGRAEENRKREKWEGRGKGKKRGEGDKKERKDGQSGETWRWIGARMKVGERE